MIRDVWSWGLIPAQNSAHAHTFSYQSHAFCIRFSLVKCHISAYGSVDIEYTCTHIHTSTDQSQHKYWVVGSVLCTYTHFLCILGTYTHCWLCVTTGKLYHSLCHWMVHADIRLLVSYESVQYKRNMFTFLFNGSLYGKKKKKLTCAYIECTTGKWYHSIELADSFLLKYRYWTFAKITASTFWKKFWASGIVT